MAAHGEVPAGPWDVWNHWAAEPVVLAGLALAGASYLGGLLRLWRRAGPGRGISRRRAAAFGAGLAVLAVALVSPLDPLGEVLFSAHMVQHLLLILVAAPLLVLGAPEVALLWVLPVRWRARVGRAWRWATRAGGGGRGGEAKAALVAVTVATAVLWTWHVPDLYDLAVRNETWHAVEHATFLGTAVLFWATVLRIRIRDRVGNGLRVLYVFAMVVQGSVLGALITFASRPLYRSHASIPEAWGLEPLVDQQLAGLLMWVPPTLLYVGVAAYLFVTWLECFGQDDASPAPESGSFDHTAELSGQGRKVLFRRNGREKVSPRTRASRPG